MGNVFALEGGPGRGKTTILERVHARFGGTFVGMRQFLAALQAHQPQAIEEAFVQMMEDALASEELVIVDDLHLVTDITGHYNYTRGALFNAALTALLDQAGQGRKLVFAVDDEGPAPLRRRAYRWEIGDFTVADYEHLCRTYLGTERAARLDYARIHRFAPRLSAHQLRNTCLWLRHSGELETELFIDYLHLAHMTSNVEIEEVAPVDWNDLRGVDDVIDALEAKVARPFESDGLAAELGLKPKRGVLLAGPPGTGKTTIGRALAHRLKSKFFLIDGTAVAGSCDFYETVGRVFDQAKRNAPSVVFIDDTDVIFENKDQSGFYRYLLTMLDGLESASAERVCVMITAMDVGSLPPAIVRSGRIELWLETRLPDESAREEILRARTHRLPPPLGTADWTELAQASRGLTGADLKAVVEDAKLLYAHDVSRGVAVRPASEYYLAAIDTVRANGRRYGRRKPQPMAGAVRIGFAMEEMAEQS